MGLSAGGYADQDRTWGALASAEGLGSSRLFSWARLPPMRTSRLRASAAAADGSLYILGGSCNGETLATTERWKPCLSSWETLPAMATRRCALAAVAARC